MILPTLFQYKQHSKYAGIQTSDLVTQDEIYSREFRAPNSEFRAMVDDGGRYAPQHN